MDLSKIPITAFSCEVCDRFNGDARILAYCRRFDVSVSSLWAARASVVSVARRPWEMEENKEERVLNGSELVLNWF